MITETLSLRSLTSGFPVLRSFLASLSFLKCVARFQLPFSLRWQVHASFLLKRIHVTVPVFASASPLNETSLFSRAGFEINPSQVPSQCNSKCQVLTTINVRIHLTYYSLYLKKKKNSSNVLVHPASAQPPLVPS